MVEYHVIKIYCSQCKNLLYKYQKGGSGHLVKCYKEKIVLPPMLLDVNCPQCNLAFAREAMIRGKPAHKIIQGKVFVKWFICHEKLNHEMPSIPWWRWDPCSSFSICSTFYGCPCTTAASPIRENQKQCIYPINICFVTQPIKTCPLFFCCYFTCKP